MFEKLEKISSYFEEKLPSVPLETQLENLAEDGICLNDGVGVDQLLLNFTRKELEDTPYAMLLPAMGGVYPVGAVAESDEDSADENAALNTESVPVDEETEEPDTDAQPNTEIWLPVSDDILYLDSDCIEDSGIYTEILERLSAMTHGDAAFTDITDTVDMEHYTAHIGFTYNEKSYGFDLEVQGTQIDSSFFSKINAALVENGTEKLFYLHLAEPEMLVIYSEPKQVKKLNSLTGVYFELL